MKHFDLSPRKLEIIPTGYVGLNLAYMKKQTKLAIFEGKKIRRHWDEGQEKWYFSVVDIIAILTSQPDGIPPVG